MAAPKCCSNHPGPYATLWQTLEATFTRPCDTQGCGVPKGKTGYFSCWGCNGTGRLLTEDGQAFLQFIKDHGGFAEKDHSHTCS